MNDCAFIAPAVLTWYDGKPSLKTDGRENYAYWCTKREVAPGDASGGNTENGGTTAKTWLQRGGGKRCG
ncbi:hypothetical protein GCM10011445_09690 [Pseudocitrobacter faecalis]|nr:hypothetical protein GCM10011445_09690 [Pseudocitrobacter faecalis]